MISFEGPPHKRTYIMGVEKVNLSIEKKDKFIATKLLKTFHNLTLNNN